MTTPLTVFKRLLFGRPVSTHAELNQRVPKSIALAVFSSDALSSSAYATDVMLVALMAAGTAALSKSIPIAAAVVFVLLVVITSYRTAVRAYPDGGGGYVVTRENLGPKPALIVAAALLIDYVLTVAVSVAAGVKAMGAAVPAIAGNRVAVALVVVLLLTLANLRGVREAGSFFAIPTYGFLISMGALIIVGLFQVLTGNHVPISRSAIASDTPLTLFLILTAFARGSTALTGVEAIANAAPSFRPPEGRNAAQTLLALGILLSILFFGITVLANAYHADPALIEAPHGQPITAQIAGAVFGIGSVMFYAIQFFTALILFLAANTAYAGFPSLASVLARDRVLPRALQNRGDKLAYSNGIVILAVAAAGVLLAYQADELRIISLYVVGVFTDFTLSQVGLVKRWLRIRGPGWLRSASFNGLGAVTTFTVLLIVSVTKFTDGAWQVILLIPLVAWGLSRVKGHYSKVISHLSVDDHPVPRIQRQRAVIVVSPVPGASLKALAFLRAVGAEEVTALAFKVPGRSLGEIRRVWDRAGINVPFERIGDSTSDLEDYIRELRPTEENPVTLVIPDPQTAGWAGQLRQNRKALRIKAAFLNEPGVVVMSVPFNASSEQVPTKVTSPGRLSVIVLVSALHRATFKAIEYARSLRPTELKAVTIATHPEDSKELLDEWSLREMDLPLHVLDAPYRSLTRRLVQEVRSLRPKPHDAVAVVIPEFVVPKWWQQALHGQTALLIKSALLFEPNVVVIDVPHVLEPETEDVQEEENIL